MLHEEIRKATHLVDRRLRTGEIRATDWSSYLAVMTALADQVEAIERSLIPPHLRVVGAGEVVHLPPRPRRSGQGPAPAPIGDDAA